MSTLAPTLTRHTLHHDDGRALHVYGALRGALPGAPAEPSLGEPGGNGSRPQRPGLHRRWDALTAAWVAVSPSRNTRPGGATAAVGPAHEAALACPLCPGGPEVPFDYDAAVFENRFPTLDEHPPPGPAAAPSPFPTISESRGRCEVVLYTSRHTGSLATLPPEVLGRIVAVWRDRSDELFADPAHAAVLIFENRGEEVGATLPHPHGQLYAFPDHPPVVRERLAALTAHREATGRCLTCAVAARDDGAPERTLARGAAFAVTVPYAPRWPYEVHVRAVRHGLRRLGDLGAAQAAELAEALRATVQRYDGLFGFPLPYMMVVQEAPTTAAGPAEDHHLAVEFLPPHRSAGKLKVRASVETAAGLFINDTVPEDSAARLAAVRMAPSAGPVVVPEVVAPDPSSPSEPPAARSRR